MINPFLLIVFEPHGKKWARALAERIDAAGHEEVLCHVYECDLKESSGFLAGYEESIRDLARRGREMLLNVQLPRVGNVVQSVFCFALSGELTGSFPGELRVWIEQVMHCPPLDGDRAEFSILLLHPPGVSGLGSLIPQRDQLFASLSTHGVNGGARLRPKWFFLAAPSILTCDQEIESADMIQADPFLEGMRFLACNAQTQALIAPMQADLLENRQTGRWLLFSTFFAHFVYFPRADFVRWMRLRFAEDLVRGGPLSQPAKDGRALAPFLRPVLARLSQLGIGSLLCAPTMVVGKNNAKGGYSLKEAGNLGPMRRQEESFREAGNNKLAVESATSAFLPNWREYLDSLLAAALPDPASSLQTACDILTQLRHGAREFPPPEDRLPSLDSIEEGALRPFFFDNAVLSWMKRILPILEQYVLGQAGGSERLTEYEEYVDRLSQLLDTLTGLQDNEPEWPARAALLLHPLLRCLLLTAKTRDSLPKTQQMKTLCDLCAGVWENMGLLCKRFEVFYSKLKWEIESKRQEARDQYIRTCAGYSLWIRLFHRNRIRADESDLKSEERMLNEKERVLELSRAQFLTNISLLDDLLADMLPSLSTAAAVVHAWEQIERELASRFQDISLFQEKLQTLLNECRQERSAIRFPKSETVSSVPKQDRLEEIYLRLNRVHSGSSYDLALKGLASMREWRSATVQPSRTEEVLPLSAFLLNGTNAYQDLLRAVANGFFKDFEKYSVVRMLDWLDQGYTVGESFGRLEELSWPRGTLLPGVSQGNVRKISFVGLIAEDVELWEKRTRQVWRGEMMCGPHLDHVAPIPPQDPATILSIHTFAQELEGADTVLFGLPSNPTHP